MEQIFSNSQVCGQAVKASSSESNNQSNNQSKDVERENIMWDALEASRDIKHLFGVEYSTIAKRIREAKKGVLGGIFAHGIYRMKGQPNQVNIYVRYEEIEKVECNCRYTYNAVTVEAFKRDWKEIGVETVKVEVLEGYYNTIEKAFQQALTAALTKYVAAWYDTVKAYHRVLVDGAAKANVETVEETVEEPANVEEEKTEAQELEQVLAQSLEDAGNNALNLAYALAEAIEHTDGAVTMDNIEEQALWRAYRAEIENRLASLSRGGDTPAPCFEEEKPVETPNDNSGNPAPGLRDEIEGMLAADWTQMGDSPLEGYIGEHRVGRGYLLETTRELWQDPFMGVRLVRLGDDHEHFWRIYRDGDIPGVADDLSKEIHANE